MERFLNELWLLRLVVIDGPGSVSEALARGTLRTSLCFLASRFARDNRWPSHYFLAFRFARGTLFLQIIGGLELTLE